MATTTTTPTETTGPIYTSVDKTKLQKAFGLAHAGAERFDSLSPADNRNLLRRIARLIWEAHGERGTAPATAGAAVLDELGVSLK